MKTQNIYYKNLDAFGGKHLSLQKIGFLALTVFAHDSWKNMNIINFPRPIFGWILKNTFVS